MRLHVQRVQRAEVQVAGKTVGAIGQGLVVLVGFGRDENVQPGDALWKKLLDKLLHLRIFPDAKSRMNASLKDFGGSLLLVSQFTLYADCRKGRRPSFHLAEDGVKAETLFARFVADAEKLLPGKVQQGIFGAEMEVSLVNWGPVTFLLDSEGF